ncbi:hypothetical protein [Clostridium magnum]|uniref:Chromosome partition protein Smc n=1 Tax=Clostridium magnum DSM 2767 TaxID=1121326 RepID=A0A162RIK1_9CLOT|nr:hypothetical protein [Clostridium magnum]KZL89959.1 hypothetical protein CLMAG_44430 [Clostridium magnum DSM 2767]SHJ32967.1 hypothetical protein SAMN02745944_05769 [Clostridium magnum DSM 2767]
MAIILTNKETIFDRSDIDNYLQKFNERVSEVDSAIMKLSDELDKARAEKQELMLKDMLTAGDEFRKPLQNITTKIENYTKMLEQEQEKKEAFIQIMQNPELEKLLEDYYKKMSEDIRKYIDVDEKAIFTELAELRDRQLVVLNMLNENRKVVENEVYDFSVVVKELGYPQYRWTVAFHDNINMPNPAFKELGSIMFNCTSIKGVEHQYEMSKRIY